MYDDSKFQGMRHYGDFKTSGTVGNVSASSDGVTGYPKDMNQTNGTPRTGVKEDKQIDWKKVRCGQCGHVDNYDIEDKEYVYCMNCSCVIVSPEEIKQMDDWKDLTTDTPIKVYQADGYQIQQSSKDIWKDIDFYPGAIKLLNSVVSGCKYRYRVKTLESIRIPEWLSHLISENVPKGCFKSFDWSTKTGFITQMNGQKVEIIGEE